MATWKRLPQEHDGEYFFSGQAVMTRGVEAAFIVADLHSCRSRPARRASS